MDLKKYFEIATGLYAVQISTYSESFAHTNYCITSNLAEDYIMRTSPLNLNFKELYAQEYEFIKIAKKEKYDSDIVFFDRDDGVKIFKKHGETTSQEDIVENYALFIKSLKNMHSLDYSNSNLKEFSPLDLYKYIRERLEISHVKSEVEDYIIKKAQNIYNNCTRKVICHNNLSLHNIVKYDNKYIFNSTQLVSVSDPLYDLANFFFKSKITNKVVIEKFLKRYLGNEYSDNVYESIKIYILLAKLIYTVWNEYLYIMTDINYHKQRYEKLIYQLNQIKM